MQGRRYGNPAQDNGKPSVKGIEPSKPFHNKTLRTDLSPALPNPDHRILHSDRRSNASATA